MELKKKQKNTKHTQKTMNALTNQEIASRCPQVFTTDYSKARTNRYGQLSTANVIDALRTEGFEVTNAFAQTRKPGQFSKHCVRLSHKDFLDTLKPADERPEIVIVNSHDGSSSFRIMAGFFRLVCSNGLIVASQTTANERIHHWKIHSIDEVINCALNVAQHAKESYEIIEQMKSYYLNKQQQLAYAQKAAKIRLAFNKNSKITSSENLLVPHRHEDNLTPSLWNTYNVVQENCIKGGQLVGTRILRPLTNISQNIDVNRKLWKEATALLTA